MMHSVQEVLARARAVPSEANRTFFNICVARKQENVALHSGLCIFMKSLLHPVRNNSWPLWIQPNMFSIWEHSSYLWKWFRWRVYHQQLGCTALGAQVTLRMQGQTPFITDENNMILDCAFGKIEDPAALALKLSQIPGVLEHGLFIGMTSLLLEGTSSGVIEHRLK